MLDKNNIALIEKLTNQDKRAGVKMWLIIAQNLISIGEVIGWTCILWGQPGSIKNDLYSIYYQIFIRQTGETVKQYFMRTENYVNFITEKTFISKEIPSWYKFAAVK